MSTLDATREELALVVLYLNKAEARDKICRAIQYGSKFLSNGQPGTAQNVDKSTSLARKVFRLFKFVNDLHGLISRVPQGTPLPLVLLGKSKNALLSTFLFLDQIVWLGRTGIYKNKERTELIGRISLFCWMGSSVCTTLVELGELGRLSKSLRKLEKNLKNSDKYQNEEYRAKLQKSNERTLALVKAGLDILVAVGLLQLAPTKVTPRVTGALGFITSLISCYQLLPSPPKSKHKFTAHQPFPPPRPLRCQSPIPLSPSSITKSLECTRICEQVKLALCNSVPPAQNFQRFILNPIAITSREGCAFYSTGYRISHPFPVSGPFPTAQSVLFHQCKESVLEA
ncbi:Peroxisomal membrane protein 11C [Hibiscus syriacus]|uniref:Peroxisomal membrane protein 11C n=1 Tax=Hibiscus syriacus TaxID=106335 RepID=A0A6A3CTJ0_HIBSY|nr:Peroxisomal membrane protein 11C [Hibiscus syriacus]